MEPSVRHWSAAARRNAWILVFLLVPLEFGVFTSHGCRVLYGHHGIKALFALYPAYLALVALLTGLLVAPLRKNIRMLCMVVMAISAAAVITAGLMYPLETRNYLLRIWWYPCVSLHYALR